MFYLIIILLFTGCTKSEISNNQATLVVDKSDDGKIEYIGYKIDGKKTGEWRRFVNDRLQRIVNYKDGSKHGKETWYDLCARTVVREGYNEMDKEVGLWYYYQYGELMRVIEFKCDTMEIIKEDLKSKAMGWPPPPPPENSIYDCED